MTDVLNFDLALEPVRFDEEKREVYGRIVPFGEQTNANDSRPYTFSAEAFADLDPASAGPLVMYHDERKPVGKMIQAESKDDGLYATFKVSDTPSGREALTLAADGVLGFSVGIPKSFAADKDGVIRKASVRHTALTPVPAFSSAQVLAVHSTTTEEVTTVENVIEENVTVTFDSSALEAQIESLNEAVQRIEFASAKPVAKPEPTGAEWFAAHVDATINGNVEALEAFADLAVQTGTINGSNDASALINREYVPSQIVKDLDGRRPLFRNLGKDIEIPKSGSGKFPVVTQHSLVGQRSAQNADVNTRKMITTLTNFDAVYYDGGVRIPLEVIQMADPSILALYWDDLLAQTADYVEATAITAVEGGATGTANDLPYDTYKNFAKAVATAAMTVRTATGAPATKLFVPYTLWPELVGFVDADDRRGMGSNDAAVALTAEEFGLPGGITVVACGVTNPVLTNERAVKGADSGPTGVEATNVQKLARDVALVGRTLIVPRIPGGIVVFDTESSSSASSSSSS